MAAINGLKRGQMLLRKGKEETHGDKAIKKGLQRRASRSKGDFLKVVCDGLNDTNPHLHVSYKVFYLNQKVFVGLFLLTLKRF